MGLGRTAVVAGALSLGIFAACSHGIYDGSAVSSDGGLSKSKIVDIAANQATTIRTDDKFFALQIPAGAFTAPTHIEIHQRADRTAQSVIVPVYEVTASTPIASGVRVAAILGAGTGFNGNPDSNRRLGVALIESGTPSLLAGGVIQGTGEYFGLTSKLGSFTIEYGNQVQFTSNPGQGCFAQCCAGNAQCVAGQLFCGGDGSGGRGGPGEVGNAGDTSFSCFLGCNANDALSAACAVLGEGGTTGPPIDCSPKGGAGPTCDSVGAPCCYRPGGSVNCDGACNGLEVRCNSHGSCPPGPGGTQLKCCLEGNTKTVCKAACGDDSRVCTQNSDCLLPGPNACNQTARCPFGFCNKNSIPAACQ